MNGLAAVRLETERHIVLFGEISPRTEFLRDQFEQGQSAVLPPKALLSKCIAEALVAQLRKEAEAHGVDVVTWLMRDKSTDE